jgi:copper(I)-binding protein
VFVSSRSVLSLRGLVLVAAAVLVPAIAGCEAGFNAPTQEWHQPAPGAYGAAGNTIRINNMFVLGSAPGTSIPAGGSAGVFLAIANSGSADRLLSATAPGAAASVQLPSGGVTLGAGQSVLLTGPSPQILLHGLTRSVNGGQVIPMRLNFQDAGSITLKVPVMPRADYFTTLSPPPPSPTASPCVTPGGTKAPQPSPSPTESATQTPSASPSPTTSCPASGEPATPSPSPTG